jgi:hypothetical protein
MGTTCERLSQTKEAQVGSQREFTCGVKSGEPLRAVYRAPHGFVPRRARGLPSVPPRPSTIILKGAGHARSAERISDVCRRRRPFELAGSIFARAYFRTQADPSSSRGVSSPTGHRIGRSTESNYFRLNTGRLV